MDEQNDSPCVVVGREPLPRLTLLQAAGLGVGGPMLLFGVPLVLITSWQLILQAAALGVATAVLVALLRLAVWACVR